MNDFRIGLILKTGYALKIDGDINDCGRVEAVRKVGRDREQRDI